jgi:hypothetical protein
VPGRRQRRTFPRKRCALGCRGCSDLGEQPVCGTSIIRGAVLTRPSSELRRSRVWLVLRLVTFTAVQGLVMDLQAEPVSEQVREFCVFGPVVRTHGQQELIVVSSQDGAPESDRRRTNRQLAAEHIDARLAVLPKGVSSSVRTVLVMAAGPRPELMSCRPAVCPWDNPTRNSRNGRTEMRLCRRVALASYTETAREATAMDASSAR